MLDPVPIRLLESGAETLENGAIPLDEGNGGLAVELEPSPVPGRLLDLPDKGAVLPDGGTGTEAAELDAPRPLDNGLKEEAETPDMGT